MVVLRVGVSSNADTLRDELESLPGRIDEELYLATVEATHLVAERYRGTINRDTGRTAETIEEDAERTAFGAEGHVGSDDDVAGYLEYGTAPHIIRARLAQALHFFIDGREIIVTEVHHPGTPEYRPLLRATDESESAVYGIYERRMGDFFEGLGSG